MWWAVGDPNSETYPFPALNRTAGMEFCDTLEFGPFNDWRYPNIIEAFVLSSHPYNDMNYSGGSKATKVSTQILSQPVETDIFIPSNFGGWRYAASHEYNSTCVRGTPFIPLSDGITSPKLFIDNEDGTVTDLETNLMWQADRSASGLISWNMSIQYCNELSLAGHSDWRLPTPLEIVTTADFSCFEADDDCEGPQIRKPFTSTLGWVWTSTTIPNNPLRAFRLNGNAFFQSSNDALKTDTSSIRAFCVRNI